MSSSRLNLPRAPIHRALTTRFMMAGGERMPVMLAAILSLYLTFIITMRFQWWMGIIVGFSIWSGSMWALRRMGKADPQMIEVFMRHIRYKSFYPARGRFTARTKNIRDFK